MGARKGQRGARGERLERRARRRAGRRHGALTAHRARCSRALRSTIASTRRRPAGCFRRMAASGQIALDIETAPNRAEVERCALLTARGLRWRASSRRCASSRRPADEIADLVAEEEAGRSDQVRRAGGPGSAKIPNQAVAKPTTAASRSSSSISIAPASASLRRSKARASSATTQVSRCLSRTRRHRARRSALHPAGLPLTFGEK